MALINNKRDISSLSLFYMGGGINVLHLAIFFISQKIFIGALQFFLTFNIITFGIFWENLNAVGAKFEILQTFSQRASAKNDDFPRFSGIFSNTK